MRIAARSALEPRKTPVQARSAATIEAIREAAIQVLLRLGAERFTTTRVAQRAGVSVGTLYQYYPNKRSLLFAVMENHLNEVTARVEAACAGARGKTLAEMIRETVETFIDAKMERADVSVALYRVSAEVGGPALVKRFGQRWKKTLNAMLSSARDLASPLEPAAVEIMLSAMSGVMRSMLEMAQGGVPGATIVPGMKEQLVVLCQAYMAATMRHK